jgi:plasmid stability protein
MASITIRNLEDDVKERLRVRAAMQGHSMEEEARAILKRAVGGVSGAQLWTMSRRLFDGELGVALEAPHRGGDRTPLNLGGDHPAVK